MRAVVFAPAATLLWAGFVALDRLSQGQPVRIDPRIAGFELVLSGIFYAVLAAAAHARRDAALLAENAERLAAADALRARAELAALRSQLNPHFVLNALHTLHALVRRDPSRAESAIEELGRLLAYGLRLQREDVDEVALSEEWAFVNDYVGIERLRFGERLKVTLEAGEDALSCRLPPFSIQPLVENAVVHGVSPRAAGGTVSIAARRQGSALEVEVRDDGGGVERSSSNGLGLGLKLIEQRLLVLYGGTASLALEKTGAGTRAVLRIPQGAGA
jgi:LytS/YehU family sensor histidine kinase